MKKLGVVVLLAAMGAAAWWFLGRGPAGGGGDAAPLSYVPADSPYVFANLEPLPQPVIDKAMQQSAQLSGMYKDIFATVREGLAKSDKPEDQRVLALFDALIAEFDSKTPQQVIDAIGLDIRGRSAIYGIGVLPVLRMEVADPERFRAFIGRMEKAAGTPLGTAKLETLDYWTMRPDAAPLMGVAALIGKHFVLTLAPADAEPAVLRTLLGLDKPAKSVLDSGDLTALNTEYGYLPYFSGYVDSRKLLAAITANSAVDQAFLTAVGAEQPKIDEVCLKELGEMAAAWPRLSVGYEVFEPTRNVSRFVVEARPDIATELMKLRAPMPGLGKHSESSLMNFGLSFKLSALPGVVGGFAGKVTSAPWQCSELAPLNKAFEEAAKNINNPAVFAAAPVFSGVHVVLNTFDMDFAAGSEPTGTGVLLIGSDNPASLIGMAKGFVPQLATLDIPADGSVIALPALPGMPPALQGHVASSDKVIGIGIGGDEVKSALPQLLTADPAQQPLFVMGLSSAIYVKFADAMAAEAAKSAEASPEAAEMLKQQAELMRNVYTTLFSRVDSRIELSEKGIELRQTVLQP